MKNNFITNKLNHTIMNKLFLLLCFMFTSFLAFSQLPYSKMIRLNKNELADAKFKYDKNKNQYILKKSNGLNKTLNVLSAANGAAADIKPHVDDYVIIRQEGLNEPSSLTVIFYNDVTFHDIQTWIADNTDDVLEVNSGKLITQQFSYDDYEIHLSIEKVGITSTTRNTSALVKSKDESYNVYTYTIFTGVEPSSKWHEKQMEKKEKRNEKGKKKDLDELM